MVRIFLKFGLVMSLVIVHLSVLKEIKSIKEISNLEETEIVCMQM